MLKEQVRTILTREPFTPFRIHLLNGKHYDIDHREVARFLGYGVLVFIGLKQGTHQAKGYDRFPFDHIVRIEDRPAIRRRKRAS
jgi:hypothetical protein